MNRHEDIPNKIWAHGEVIFAVLLDRRIVDSDGNDQRRLSESPLGERI